jgi:predicted HTH domain antitoxin
MIPLRYISLMKLVLELPDDPLVSLTRRGEDVPAFLRMELACGLYREGHITVAQASQLAGMHVSSFGQELARRNIVRQIGTEEIEQDRVYVSALTGCQ